MLKSTDFLPFKTGESFNLGEYTVLLGNLDPSSKNLLLTVYPIRGGASVLPTPPGRGNSRQDFPYDFRLVAFKNPVLKRMWVDLQLSRDSRIIAEGSSEVNSPFHWEGLDFFHVQTKRDPAGRAYAGIQIVRDPGRPLVFPGFAIVVLGALLIFARRFYGHH